MRYWSSVLLVSSLVVGLSPAHAEGRAYPEVSLYDTETRTLTSSFNSQGYRILVALPRDYPKPNEKYPVVYLLDGDILFGMVTETARLLPLEGFFLGRQIVPNLIIVGIGYQGGPKEMALKRDRDLTWREDADENGAQPFFDFLKEELIPLVESSYEADPSSRTLIGTSTGGLFALGVLLQRPGTFHRYVVSSPKLDPVIFGLEEQYSRKHKDLQGTVYISAGSAGRIEQMISDSVDQFHQILSDRNYPGLDLMRETLEGESHVSAQPTAFTRGLKAVFFEPSGKKAPAAPRLRKN